MQRLLLLGLFLLTACGSAPTSGDPHETPEVGQSRDSVVVPLTLHVVVEAGQTDSDLSSLRTVEELEAIAIKAAQIWEQAHVVFDPINVHVVEMPTSVLQGIALGSTDQFFAEVNTTFFVEDGQAINGFFVRSALGFNGLTPQGSNLFFVADEPTVPDERVTSHELGHIFGLHHDLADSGQLMFSGTNGTGLSALEQTVARYSIQGLFPQATNP